MNNLFKEFNKNFFKRQTAIKWFDKEGLWDYHNGHYIISITLDDIGSKGEYTGYTVKIYDRTLGLVVSKFFKFEYYLEMTTSGTDYCHVWYNHNGKKLDWYINKPLDIKPIVDEIISYVQIFVTKHNHE